MKKLLKIFGILAVLGIIALVVVDFSLGPIVKKSINSVGPQITGTRVELNDAKISPLTGGGTLTGLFVGNPKGWTGDKAIYLGTIRASIQPASLLGDHIVVNEVFIDGPEFVYEQGLGGSNIDALLKQIEANTGGGTRPPKADPTEPGDPTKFSVKTFRLQNARMTLMAAGRTLTVPLPPLTITDLGVAEGGITSDQVATRVLRQVLAQMGAAAAAEIKNIGAAALKGGSKGAKEAAKGALDKLLGR